MTNHYLFELGTEELPPKALKSFTRALRQSVEKSLTEAGLKFSTSRALNSPRRLALIIEGLEKATPLSESKVWGPPAKIAFKDGEPTKAALGFCQRNNIDIKDASVESDGKVEKLCCLVKQGGENSADLLPGFFQTALDSLPIPKRMRWAASRTEFVRPVHWLVLMKDSEVVPATILGLNSSNQSRGHRFLSEGTIIIPSVNEYTHVLEELGKVQVDPVKRHEDIENQVKLAEENGGTAVIDEDLLDEVTALVEWPVAVLGKFDERFLNVPSEALVSSMKEHQKYFHVENEKGELLPCFITISNIETNDYSAIRSGNEKVIRPRLDDAAFFFETDKKTSLEARCDKLKSVVFQAQLGSICDKTERIGKIANFICDQLKLDASIKQACLRAAKLCKSDLVSSMVYEFADMQGIAGYHYALNDGEEESVAKAISEHYLPKFSGDALPSNDVGTVVAIADRIDSASVSVLRLFVEKEYNLDLKAVLAHSATLFTDLPKNDTVVETALNYILERFKAWYEEANIGAEVFVSVASKELSEPLDIHQRVLAVSEFYASEDAKALAAANKRVANILAKLDTAPSGQVDNAQLKEQAEKDLAQALKLRIEEVQPLFAARNYSEGLSKLSSLRSTVDAFFDNVMVMDEDLALRENRLNLLQQLRQLFFEVADISLLAPSK